MSWLLWLRVVAVTVVLVPFVQLATRFWAERAQVGGRHLRVVETCSLGNDGRLYLVEVAGKVFALACGSKGVQVVDEVTAPEVLAEVQRGVGVGGEAIPLAVPARNWLATAVALLRRVYAERRSGSGAERADGAGRHHRAVEVLQGQVRRVRHLGSAGDEVFAVGKR